MFSRIKYRLEALKRMTTTTAFIFESSRGPISVSVPSTLFVFLPRADMQCPPTHTTTCSDGSKRQARGGQVRSWVPPAPLALQARRGGQRRDGRGRRGPLGELTCSRSASTCTWRWHDAAAADAHLLPPPNSHNFTAAASSKVVARVLAWCSARAHPVPWPGSAGESGVRTRAERSV